MRLALVLLLAALPLSACGDGGYKWENASCFKDGQSVSYKECAKRHLIPGS